jgi:glutamyl-tRNA reductase
MKLFAAGVSHKTAPVEVREQLAVQRNELADLAHYLKWFGYLDEIVLLSTCNRVEIYGTTRQSIDSIKSALQLLSSEAVDLDPYIYVHKDAEAARHLFRVTSGLDSMVLGETEVNRPLLLIDLSVPRNIDAAIADLDNVSLYNIDDLEALARQGMRDRAAEVAACYEIIDAHVAVLIEKLNAGTEPVHAAGKNNRLLRQEFATALTPLLQPT